MVRVQLLTGPLAEDRLDGERAIRKKEETSQKDLS